MSLLSNKRLVPMGTPDVPDQNFQEKVPSNSSTSTGQMNGNSSPKPEQTFLPNAPASLTGGSSSPKSQLSNSPSFGESNQPLGVNGSSDSNRPSSESSSLPTGPAHSGKSSSSDSLANAGRKAGSALGHGSKAAGKGAKAAANFGAGNYLGAAKNGVGAAKEGAKAAKDGMGAFNDLNQALPKSSEKETSSSPDGLSNKERSFNRAGAGGALAGGVGASGLGTGSAVSAAGAGGTGSAIHAAKTAGKGANAKKGMVGGAMDNLKKDASQALSKGVKSLAKAGSWKFYLISGTVAVGLILLVCIVGAASVLTGSGLAVDAESCQVSTDEKPSTGGSVGGGGNVTGEWTQEGTDANLRAKQVFQSWVDRGFSGAAAAGAVGNVRAESGPLFHPLFVEFSYAGDLKANYYSDAVGGILYPDAAGVGVGASSGTHGFGIYQVSPGSKLAFKSPGVRYSQAEDGYEYKNVFGEATGSVTDAMVHDNALLAAEIDNQTDYIWRIAGGAAMTHGLQKLLQSDPVKLKNLAGATTIEDGTKWFYCYVENNRPDLWDSNYTVIHRDVREDTARKAYEMFGGKDIQMDETLIGASGAAGAGSSSQKEDNDCSSSDSDSDGDIVATARKYLGWFSYLQDHSLGAFKDWDNPPKDAKTDCSGFVWFVLHKTGKYSVPEAMGWFTGSMEADAKGPHKWLKEIPASEAGPGDVVIVNTGTDGAGSNGHTGILVEKWVTIAGETYTGANACASNPTKIIQEGGGSDCVAEIEFNKSFGSALLTSDRRVVFARPVLKSESGKEDKK